MKTTAKKILILASLMSFLGASLVGCSTGSTPKLEQTSGFLPNYSQLKPIPSPKNSQIYTYTVPGVKRSDYHAIIVNPVMLYQTATKQGVSQKEINTARANIDAGVKNIVSQYIPITTTAGPGVAQLQVAITGATVDEAGFSPLNIIPISAAIKLATMATDTDSKTPALVVELKFTDSVSGKLLREDVTMINGDSFRNRAHTAEEFQALAQTWVQQALQYVKQNNS